jgi:hypothetical protein
MEEYNKLLGRYMAATSQLNSLNNIKLSIRRIKEAGYETQEQVLELIKKWEKIVADIEKEMDKY